MKRIMIGTAGHVDHGKTALTQKLTGVNTDRLAQEQARGISIELGFAPLKLGPDLQAGIIDVPGHEKFIKTMLAGVAGIDLVLLVIAADEGLMPQTLEHLDIINLLGIQQGIVVLTKTDLVDEDWLELIREEITQVLAKTPLKDAPIAEVSAYTGAGIPQLLAQIKALAETVPPRPTTGQPRLPIDRSFSITGFGTVATGTLWSGKLVQGEFLEILPTDKTGRIRTLQVYGKQAAQALAGQRVAVNLAGIEVAEVEKGGWLASAGLLKATYRLDVALNLLATAKELNHNARVRIHHGTKEVLGRVHFLDREVLKPGEDAFIQLSLEEPLPPLRGDRLILRSYSPLHTIAGGTVIDVSPKKHKRYQPEVLKNLTAKAAGSPDDLIFQELDQSKTKILSQGELLQLLGFEPELLQAALTQLLAAEKIVGLEGDFYVTVYNNQQLWQATQALLGAEHKKYPLRFGLAKEEFRGKILNGIPQKAATALLSQWQGQGLIELGEKEIALAGHTPTPTPQILSWQAQTEKILAEADFSPPPWYSLTADLPEGLQAQVLPWLISENRVIKLQEEIVLLKTKVEAGTHLALEHLAKEGTLSLGQMRDLLHTSRKYALAFLEYLDSQKITKRKEDLRIRY